LLKTIAKLINPISGNVYIDGKEIESAKSNDIYMMHQNYANFDWLTCLENILIAKRIKHKITKEDIENAHSILKDVGLNDYAERYPSELSGGMKQRLALARTIFVKPKIILMDEPLSALDEMTRKNMQQLILNLHKQTNNTILLVTHSKEEANIMCDNILNLK
jgi:ABC-type nitrate/sulfonate/bicarbonate transport system ATPase subunit